MLKKIGLGVLCSGLIFASGSFAQQMTLPQMGTTIVYELKSNDPLELFNFTFWTINAVCKISSEDESDEIRAKILNRSGIINGQSLSEGDAISMIVHNNDEFNITAESRAKVELLNLGAHTVKASCSATA